MTHELRESGAASWNERRSPALLRGNFFSINLEAVRSALEKLPWVRKVEVRRQWPSRIEVKDRGASCRWPVWGEGDGANW